MFLDSIQTKCKNQHPHTHTGGEVQVCPVHLEHKSKRLKPIDAQQYDTKQNKNRQKLNQCINTSRNTSRITLRPDVLKGVSKILPIYTDVLNTWSSVSPCGESFFLLEPCPSIKLFECAEGGLKNPLSIQREPSL